MEVLIIVLLCVGFSLFDTAMRVFSEATNLFLFLFTLWVLIGVVMSIFQSAEDIPLRMGKRLNPNWKVASKIVMVHAVCVVICLIYWWERANCTGLYSAIIWSSPILVFGLIVDFVERRPNNPYLCTVVATITFATTLLVCILIKL